MARRLDRFVPSQTRPLMTALEREIETGRWMFPCQAKRASEFRNNIRHEEERDKNSKYSDVTHHEPTRHFRLRFCHVTWWRMTWVGFCDVTRTTIAGSKECGHTTSSIYHCPGTVTLQRQWISGSRPPNGQRCASPFERPASSRTVFQ
jgi:hypothetical protein